MGERASGDWASGDRASGDWAVRVTDVSKTYRLRRDRPHSMKEAVVNRRRRKPAELFPALRNVSFDVPRGSFFGLIGHNGSGKSTLLKLIANIHRPTQGKVEVKGRLSALLELGSGFHPELSGRDNIYLNAAIMGLGRRDIEAQIDNIIEFSGIGDFVDAPVKVLSSGMYVRLGFSVSVHVAADVLLMDEVISVGDEAFQRKCLARLEDLREAGVTIVLVSHALELVEEHADVVGWLDHGELKRLGSPSEVCAAYLASVDASDGSI